MKVISGGQSGADIAGLIAAKQQGLETGGTMPKGFKTLDGPKPEYAEIFGIEEHSSASYVPRTHKNVKDSDATMRLASNFKSAGEICTLNAIEKYGKPHFDVNLSQPCPIEDAVSWIKENNIKILNIAGNAEQTSPGTYKKVKSYLIEVFSRLK